MKSSWFLFLFLSVTACGVKGPPLPSVPTTPQDYEMDSQAESPQPTLPKATQSPAPAFKD